ncbi:MAG TPA: hypothetical protein ENK75_04920 [Saprospiraceae bacterium]|nr:hypothetical protein [Saprospiraceae bacterium]
MKNTILLLIGISLLLGSCDKDDNGGTVIEKEYGKKGTHEVAIFTAPDFAYSSIYYPSDLASMEKKSPIIFFASGWFGSPEPATKYESLLTFIASHGYTVVYTDEGSTTDFHHSIDGYEQILSLDFVKNNIQPYFDTSKIGVLGHSAGGGIAFTILDYYSKEKGYGDNGRCLMVFDPWFAFDMDESDMKALPANTNVILLKFGIGGNNDADGTDARIPLTEFYLLESIVSSKKDYQVFENADHHYPTGNRDYSEMQAILKPLDGLLDYTFVEQTERIRNIALSVGTDDPYANGNGIQVVKPKDEYPYPCDGANTLIDYCSIVP